MNAGSAPAASRVAVRWEILILLWCAYFLHQADKQIFGVVLPAVRADLKLTGYEAGLVATIFTLVLAIVSPLAGALGDRFRKRSIIIAAVAIWSAGTAFTAAAGSLAMLLLFRSLMTAGAESFYPPVSHAFIAEHHTRTRALAMSIHQIAQYSGPIASGFLSGWIAERAGWRWGFVIFGCAGLLLSLWMVFRLRNAAGAPVPVAGGHLLAGFGYCFRIPAVRLMGFAFASVLFVTTGYNTWAPSIFGHQFGLSLSQAGFQTAAWTSVSAMCGALLGGALSDRLAVRGRPRLVLQAIALVCAVPFLWMLGAAKTLPLALTALAGTGFFRGIYEGTIAVTLYDAIAERHRAAAAAVVLLIANLLASPSSAALGWIADHADLGRAVSALSVCFAAGAATLFWASRLPSGRAAEGTERLELTPTQ